MNVGIVWSVDVAKSLGSGFLKHMVRNIVGTLLEAGKGNLDVHGLSQFLSAPAGRHAGPTAPAKGLLLICVNYDR